MGARARAKKKARAERVASAKAKGISVGSGAFARKSSGDSSSSSSSGGGGVSRPTDSGGTQIITAGGKVTTRDAQGKLVSRFQAEPSQAAKIVRKGSSENLAIIQQQAKVREAQVIKAGEPVFVEITDKGLSKDVLKKGSVGFEPTFTELRPQDLKDLQRSTVIVQKQTQQARGNDFFRKTSAITPSTRASIGVTSAAVISPFISQDPKTIAAANIGRAGDTFGSRVSVLGFDVTRPIESHKRLTENRKRINQNAKALFIKSFKSPPTPSDLARGGLVASDLGAKSPVVPVKVVSRENMFFGGPTPKASQVFLGAGALAVGIARGTAKELKENPLGFITETVLLSNVGRLFKPVRAAKVSTLEQSFLSRVPSDIPQTQLVRTTISESEKRAAQSIGLVRSSALKDAIGPITFDPVGQSFNPLNPNKKAILLSDSLPFFRGQTTLGQFGVEARAGESVFSLEQRIAQARKVNVNPKDPTQELLRGFKLFDETTGVRISFDDGLIVASGPSRLAPRVSEVDKIIGKPFDLSSIFPKGKKGSSFLAGGKLAPSENILFEGGTVTKAVSNKRVEILGKGSNRIIGSTPLSSIKSKRTPTIFSLTLAPSKAISVSPSFVLVEGQKKKVFNLLNTKLDSAVSVIGAVKVDARSRSKVKSLIDTRSSSKSGTILRVDTISSTIVGQTPKVVQSSTFKLGTKVTTVGKTRFVPRLLRPPPKIPKVPKVPLVPTGIVSKPFTTPRVTSKAFDVLIKRGGKFRLIGEGLGRGAALDLGVRGTKSSLSASFKLKASGSSLKTSRGTGDFARFGSEFRTFKRKKGEKIPLSDEFIQKRKFRLGTGRERSQIQKARKSSFFKISKSKGGFL